MIPLDKFKKLLGTTGENMTDDEIKKVRDLQYQLVDLLFDSWVDSIEKKHKEQSEQKLEIK